jgi:hypothetical protein
LLGESQCRSYSTKNFFRQMPNTLLTRYLHVRRLFGELDFSAMKEIQPGALFTAWLDLSNGQRNAMDAGFQEILEMSCEKGFRNHRRGGMARPRRGRAHSVRGRGRGAAQPL